jgi:YYY domain-containing protein
VFGTTKKIAWTDLLKKPVFYLAIILVLGGLFRFYNLNWDFKHSFHPDERNILGQTTGIQASNGYRVQFFAYGQLPVFLYRFTGELVSTPSFVLSLFNGNEGVAQWLYWIVLGGLSLLLAYFLSRENLNLIPVGATALLLLALLIGKLYPVFNMWFDALDSLSLKLACFLFVCVISFGISIYASYIMELEWVGTPLYISSAVVFVLGIIPFFLSDAFAKSIGALAFTLTVLSFSLWWAWVSRWGRTLLGLLCFWSFWAALNHSGRQYTGYGELMIIGRWWAALFSTATIWAVYEFVKKTYRNQSMALLAAACFAFAVVSIEQAHYCITESFITLMMVVVTYIAFEISQNGSWKNYLLAGAAFGLSMAAKTSCLYYVFIIVTGHLVFLAKTPKLEWEKIGKKEKENIGIYSTFAALLLVGLTGAFAAVIFKFYGLIHDLFSQNATTGIVVWGILAAVLGLIGAVFAIWGVMEFKVLRAQMPQWLRLATVGGLASFIFCLLSPWSLLDIGGFSRSMDYEWHVVSLADACYVIQFKDTLRYIYQLSNLVSVELWWPLGIMAVLGMFLVLGRLAKAVFSLKKNNYLLPAPFVANKGISLLLPDLLILSWFIPYFGFIGAWNTKFIRYMVPLIPVFCIFAAEFLMGLFQWLKNKVSYELVLKRVLITLVVGSSLFYSAAYMHVYRYFHPWIASSIWMVNNIPPGSSILKEAWDDGLPTGVDHSMDPSVEGNKGPQNYRQQDITIDEMNGYNSDDNPYKKNYYANIIQQGDYISIASKKLWYTLTACSPEFKPTGYNVYPVTSRYYRLLWSGLLGYKMVGEFHNFPGLFGLEIPDDTAEESFSVYDHPRVYIFKKVETVPPERIFQMLSSDDYVKGIDRNLMRTITPKNVDAFIAQRHQYLQDKGLLQQLDQTAPVTAASALATPAVDLKKVPAPPTASDKSRKKNLAAASAATVEPTPEMKVQAPATVPGLPSKETLQVLQSYAEHPVIVDDLSKLPDKPEEKAPYLWRAWFSWLLFLMVLGWLAMPLTLKLFSSMPSGAYSLSKILGFFIFAWVVWFFTSFKLCRFTVGSCWLWFLLLAALSVFAFWRNKESIQTLYSKWGRAWMIQEAAFALAFALFTIVRMYNPHVHDPGGEGYNGGGEAGMDFGFLSSIVRGETFPPQNMWMAGQPIGYTFYYGHLMMGILTKTLGLVPAVTYNLSLVTLFALIFSGVFGIAFSLSGNWFSGWIAGILCAVTGNPAASRQYMEALHQCLVSRNLGPLFNMNYDYWGPTRVIPFGNGSGSTINEFPYFSVLFGDMHAHTLAMPFAILLIGVIAALYLSASEKPFDWKGDRWLLLMAGFLLGGLAFLNTWEVPVWFLFLGLILLVRSIASLNGLVLFRGLTAVFAALLAALTLLGWWLRSGLGEWAAGLLKSDLNNNALGGTTGFLILFVLLGFAAGIAWMFTQKSTRGLASRFLSTAAVLGAALLAAGILWSPFFANFIPQQNKVMWVKPDIRTSLWNYFSVYGFFLVILLLSFVAVYSKEIFQWVGKAEGKKQKLKWDLFLEKAVEGIEWFVSPGGAVKGMMGLGIASLLVLWGASWIHWVTSPVMRIVSQALATLGAGFLALAVWKRDRWELWMGLGCVVLLWASLLVTNLIPLDYGASFAMGLGLFSVLWLLAFFHLGLAVKVFKDRKLSFAYLTVSFFFFVTATLEIFVMSEYFGFGDGMRNNSMFKYGIVAWTLASIAAGIFLPKVFDFFKNLFKAVKKESPFSRGLMTAVAGLFLFTLLRVLLDSFIPSLLSPLISIANIVIVAGLLTWSLMENWFQKGTARVLAISAAVILLLISLFSLILQMGYGAGMPFTQGWVETMGIGFMLPAVITLIILACYHFVYETQKNMGRKLLTGSWAVLFTVLALMISIYPLAATTRKCHDFFDGFRKQWVGYAEPLTLNGLEFIQRANPADGAAIRFLNEHIPDQPCLMEFVGEGYNSWGSRFSIFTGIPALMGWDGHVNEWVGARQGDDIRARRAANETIFGTTDVALAKKYLDAYGVRLVMIGTVERNGVPGRKGGYPQAGLDKFPTFLPLIYKNPQVEIYYNPPAVQN